MNYPLWLTLEIFCWWSPETFCELLYVILNAWRNHHVIEVLSIKGLVYPLPRSYIPNYLSRKLQSRDFYILCLRIVGFVFIVRSNLASYLNCCIVKLFLDNLHVLFAHQLVFRLTNLSHWLELSGRPSSLASHCCPNSVLLGLYLARHILKHIVQDVGHLSLSL